MPRGPAYFGRKTPLPGTGKRSHIVVEPDRRKEDRHVGLEDVAAVKVRYLPHERCRKAITANHPVRGCVHCRWLMGVDDPETRWFDFWADHGEDR